MKLITNIENISLHRWLELIDRSPVASIFQTPDMADFYKKSGLYETIGCAVEDDGLLKGMVLCLIQYEGKGLKKKFTSRAIINGGPLLDSDISTEALSLLLHTLKKQIAHRCIYLETRNLNDYSHWRSVFETCGFKYIQHYNFHIDTSIAEMVDKRMDKSRRRRIRRANENGVSISWESPDIKGFYDILSNLYRTKIHKPLPPFSMFEQLSKIPFAKYFIVKDAYGKTIGGQLILMLNQRVAYAWYCCGLDKEYHDLYPSIMANYAAIRYAVDNGFERYDMMGAGTPKEDYGVRNFKAQFGGILVEHGRFIIVNKPLIYRTGCFAMSIINKSKK